MEEIQVGDHVVTPRHGAGTVTAINERDGARYVDIHFDHRGLSITLPLDLAQEQGLRSVMPKKQIPKVLKILTEDGTKMPDDHRARATIVSAQCLSIDPADLAGLIRDLESRRAEGRQLSAVETRSLETAKAHLASELQIVKGLDSSEQASVLIDETVAEAHSDN